MILDVIQSKYLSDKHFELLCNMPLGQPIILEILRNKLILNHTPNGNLMNDIDKWVNENCRGFCYNPNNSRLFYFENSNDMLQFKLVWQGYNIL